MKTGCDMTWHQFDRRCPLQGSIFAHLLKFSIFNCHTSFSTKTLAKAKAMFSSRRFERKERDHCGSPPRKPRRMFGSILEELLWVEIPLEVPPRAKIHISYSPLTKSWVGGVEFWGVVSVVNMNAEVQYWYTSILWVHVIYIQTRQKAALTTQNLIPRRC